MHTKAFFLSFLLLLFFHDSNAQVWTKVIGTSDTEIATSMAVLPDGDIIIGGIYDYLGGDIHNHNYLMRTDAEGNLIWENIFGITNLEGAFTKTEGVVDVQLTTENEIAVLGFAQPNGLDGWNQMDVYFALFSQDGDQIWRKDISMEKLDDPRAFVQTNDGGFAITGRSNSMAIDTFYSDIMVLKLDAVGEVSWVKYFGGEHEDSGDAITLTAEGDIAILGIDREDWDNAMPYFFALDAEAGELVWENFYPQFPDVTPYSISTLADGGYMLMGNTVENSTVQLPWACKVDAQGDPVWFSANCADCKRGIYRDALICQAGNVLAVGYGGQGTLHEGFLVEKLDDSGQSTWANLFFPGADTIEYGLRLDWTPDGDIIALGGVNTPSADVILMKFTDLDCQPEEGVNATLTADKAHFKTSIAPNPNHGTFTVSIQKKQPQEGVFRLFNSIGEQVLMQSFFQNEFTISTGHLPAGHYYYLIEEEGVRWGFGKVMVY